MNQSIKLRAVLKGDDMVVGVEGGFIRRPVGEDGVVVAMGAEEIFLPQAKLNEALTALERRRARPLSAMRPMRAAQMELPAQELAPGRKISG